MIYEEFKTDLSNERSEEKSVYAALGHFLRRKRCMSLNLQSASGGPQEQPHHFLLALGEGEEVVHVSVSENCQTDQVDTGPHDWMIVLRIFYFRVRDHIKEFSSRWVYCIFFSLLHNADVVPR